MIAHKKRLFKKFIIKQGVNMFELLHVKKRPCNYNKVQALIYCNINGSREELISPMFYNDKALTTYVDKLVLTLEKSVI